MGFKKEYKVYGDLLFQHKPTIKSLLLHILYNNFINRERAKLPVYREKANFVDPNKQFEQIDTEYIALVSEGVVVELIRLNKNTANIILSKKTKLIAFDPKEQTVKKGMQYKDAKFLGESKNEKN